MDLLTEVELTFGLVKLIYKEKNFFFFWVILLITLKSTGDSRNEDYRDVSLFTLKKYVKINWHSCGLSYK